MKRLLFIILLPLALSVAASGQCSAPAGFACVPQETMNRLNKALDELGASRDAIAKLVAAQAASDAKAAAAQSVIDKANEIMALDVKMFTSYDKVIDLYQKTLALYADLVEKLTTQLNKPRSAWSKFLATLEKVAAIALGIAIGRGL